MSTSGLAKITWSDPRTNNTQEFVLAEGATAEIGRAASNNIHIPEQHVSRKHAVIRHVAGVFMISDLGSVNGTFVNDEQINDAVPLISGDKIRLFVPVLTFSATVSEEDERRAEEKGTLITATVKTGQGKLIISNGSQEGQTIPLLLKDIRIGRATTKADWEIALEDVAVSRPHARMERVGDSWVIHDLGSANGTLVNESAVSDKGHVLKDGDILTIGTTLLLFRG